MNSKHVRRIALACAAPVAAALAQTTATTDTASLDALVARALATSATVRAASDRVNSARARVLPSGLLADPVLTMGWVNQPLGAEKSTASSHGVPASSTGPDPMTMRMVGVAQSLPWPGKLDLRRHVADRDVEVAERVAETAARDVTRDVKDVYFELAFVDRATSIVERNRDLLSGFIGASEARYASGSGGQDEALKTRTEATALAATAVALAEQRRTALARLNALLDRPSDIEVVHPTTPPRIARAAVGQSPVTISFASSALGARAADSPLPPLAELQDAALRDNPELREHEAMIAAQSARTELARKDFLPDFDLSLQYGQRSGGLPDMVSAFVSVPLPLHKRSRQDQRVAEHASELASLHAEHDARRNQLRAEVARLVSDIERERAQLAIYVTAIIPQGRAALAQAISAWGVNRTTLLALLDDQATLYRYETEYWRTLSDFARSVNALERVVGKEILP